MAEGKSADRAEDGDIKKTPEYRKFRALLKKVVKAPPLRKRGKTVASHHLPTSEVEHWKPDK